MILDQFDSNTRAVITPEDLKILREHFLTQPWVPQVALRYMKIICHGCRKKVVFGRGEESVEVILLKFSFSLSFQVHESLFFIIPTILSSHTSLYCLLK